MALIDKLVEPTKDYISFKNLMMHLSGLNNEPLYEVVTYLLHYNFYIIDFYRINMDYKILPEKNDKTEVADYLTEIQEIFFMNYQHWIYKSDYSLNELDNATSVRLFALIGHEPNIHFKKSELLSFPQLADAHLLHFNDIQEPIETCGATVNSSITPVDDLLIDDLLSETPDINTPKKQKTSLDDAHLNILLQQQRERIAELEQKIEELESNQTTDSLSGLAKVNAERSAFKSTGRAIANYLWEMDVTESIRTGDMVQQLRKILPHINPDLIPDSNDTIRNWLSDIAPPHAKKSGRTPDDAPKEISLIMKI